MGRPKKQTADYFPHFVGGSRRTLFVLEEEWKNDGYAFWFKLLEMLCESDGHYFDMSSTANKKYLCAYAKVSEETITKILDTLADLGNIDKELWEKREIVWCQQLVDNLKALYDKRTTPMPQKPGFGEFTPETQPTEEKQAEIETPPKSPAEKPKKSPKDEPPKVKYADYVSMTEKEHEKLVELFGNEITARMIEILDNYKGSKGKTYKNDYRAILSWVVDKVKEEQAKNGGASGYGRTEINAGNNASNPGGFKPSGGFKK